MSPRQTKTSDATRWSFGGENGHQPTCTTTPPTTGENDLTKGCNGSCSIGSARHIELAGSDFCFSANGDEYRISVPGN